MSTVYKFVDSDTCNASYTSPFEDVENNEMLRKIYGLLREFSEVVLGGHTKAYTILKILVEPQASKDMCKSCGLCDEGTFDIDRCSNYNENIGKYLNVNRTMVANKVVGIRRRLPKWLAGQDSDEAKYLLSIIPNKFKMEYN
jgi:hypothetical protein